MSNAVMDKQEDVIADLKPSFKPTEMAKTTRYHVGIFENAPPAWFILLAGVTFPVISSTFDPEDREIRRAGSFVDLTLEHVKKVKKALENSVVRWRRVPKTGKPIEATIHDRTISSFNFEAGDEPLAKYVYFRKAPLEIEQPGLAENTIAMLDAAIKEAEASEERANQNPEDARTRELHSAAKRAGVKVRGPEDMGI
jgi:hypothetical protein